MAKSSGIAGDKRFTYVQSLDGNGDIAAGGGGGATGGLTDTQLRATAVPVSAAGAFWQATQPVSLASVPTHGVTGTFWQTTQPVSGPFFQTTQPISAAALPLPTGSSTEATLSAVSGKLPATLGQKALTASLAVALASDQALPLPAGAATETTLDGVLTAVTDTSPASTVEVGVTLADASIPNASGASETVAALNSSRRYLLIHNPSPSVSWWINPSGGVAVAKSRRLLRASAWSAVGAEPGSPQCHQGHCNAQHRSDRGGRLMSGLTLPYRRAVVDIFTANGTWTKRPGAKTVRVYVTGAGAGGGSGWRGNGANAGSGGGGGGGGCTLEREFNAADLTDTVAITVGAAGTGGAAATGVDNAGSVGGDSTFGSYLPGLAAVAARAVLLERAQAAAVVLVLVERAWSARLRRAGLAVALAA